MLEGGGMRGAYTSGVLEAFDEAGLRFTRIVAVSAGACAGASFVAGQSWRNRRVYLEHLSGRQLVRFHRLLTGGNVMDIDYLTDEVTLRLCPLDLDAIRSSDTELLIGVTDWLTGDTRFLSSRRDDLLTAFRATCALPFFYRGRVVYEDRRYVDGGVSDPVPVEEALRRGARDVTVVLTSPIESRARAGGRVPGLERVFSSSPAIRRALRERHERYGRAAATLGAPPEDVALRVVRPSRPLPVGRTTTDRALLEQACDLGYRDGTEAVSAYSLSP